MEQSRKQLKTWSIVVLIFAGLTLFNVIGELIFGSLKDAEIPAGSPENILLITQIFVAVISCIILLPQVYIGIKGLKMAKNPTSSRAHIVWAIILLVISALGLISPLLSIIKLEDVWANVSSFCSILVETIVFFEYVTYARLVAKGN